MGKVQTQQKSEETVNSVQAEVKELSGRYMNCHRADTEEIEEIIKAAIKKCCDTSFPKAKKREYRQRPEVKERRREYQNTAGKDKRNALKITREYQFLLGLKKRSQRQQIRLLALAEYLGRDYEEWRTEDERKNDIGLKEANR